MATDTLLNLSTTLKPTKKFKVDGVPYDIFGVDHLTPDDEAEVMALFARYQSLEDDLEGEKNTTKGANIASNMRSTRLTILTKLTSLTRDVAAKLPLTQQVKLLEVVQAETEAEDDNEEPAADDDARPEDEPS